MNKIIDMYIKLHAALTELGRQLKIAAPDYSYSITFQDGSLHIVVVDSTLNVSAEHLTAYTETELFTIRSNTILPQEAVSAVVEVLESY